MSTPRDPYFAALQASLHASDVFQPTLMLDLDRIDANIDVLLGDLPVGMGYRIVAKSLPCLKLLAHIRARTGTDRLMTFNLPMVMSLARAMPDAEQLLGKPLPAAAMKHFLQTDLAGAAKIKWLIDTPERLAAYAAVSESFGAELDIVLELDVGLHRGGFEPGEALNDALANLSTSNRLNFSGFMGYEPHLAALPKTLGWQDRARTGAWEIYAAALTAAQDKFGQAHLAGVTRNAAGSPTYRLYADTEIANEVSVGSALVKPTDFDTDLLAPFQPASFIATPVLKAPGQTRMPGLEFADRVKRAIDPGSAQTFFIHGGHWLATPVDPPNLTYNKIFGRSSNQEMLNGPATTRLTPDDFVFLRPSQSEAVFLQFGDCAVYQDGQIVDWWPVFDVSA